MDRRQGLQYERGAQIAPRRKIRTTASYRGDEMSTREDRVLMGVATAVGTALGAAAAETEKAKRYVKAKKRVVVKKVREARSKVAKGRKAARATGKKLRAKVRQIRKVGKRR